MNEFSPTNPTNKEDYTPQTDKRQSETPAGFDVSHYIRTGEKRPCAAPQPDVAEDAPEPDVDEDQPFEGDNPDEQEAEPEPSASEDDSAAEEAPFKWDCGTTAQAEPSEELSVEDEFPFLRSQSAMSLKIGSDAEIAQQLLEYIAIAKDSEVVFDECGFYVYSGTAWDLLNKETMERLALRWDGANYYEPGRDRPSIKRFTSSTVRSVVTLAAGFANKKGFFANKKDGINCANGFLSIDSHGNISFEKHSPSFRCRHTLVGEWKGKAEEEIKGGTLFYKLMHGCFAGEPDEKELISLWGEVFGVAAAGYARKMTMPKVICALGTEAGNGKSQLLKLADTLLPENSVSHLTPSQMEDPVYLVQMTGKLLNTAGELKSSAIESDIFKQVVDGSPVAARNLWKEATHISCVAQHIFAGNKLPSFKGGFDKGVKRRVLPIVFNRVIPLKEQVLDIGERVGTEEASDVLSFAVAGLIRVVKNNGQFNEPQSCKIAFKKWVADADQVEGWVDDCVKLEPSLSTKIPTKDAYSHFREWCRDNGMGNQVPVAARFTQRAMQAGLKYNRTGNDGRYFHGCIIEGLDKHREKMRNIERRRQGLWAASYA